MISINKKRSEEKTLDSLMTSAHGLVIRVRIMDLNHKHKKDMTQYFADGQVTIDTEAEVTRALDLTLLDPLHRVNLDPDDPSETSIFIADMISIVYVVIDPYRKNNFEIPIFCGPVSAVERDDVEISVKALGKESLGLANVWDGRTFKEGQEKTTVIKQILRDIMGETKLDVKDRAAKLPQDQKLNSEDKPWTVAKKIAGSMNMQLFYDGRGVAVLRKRSSTPVVTLDEQWLTTEPQPSYDLSAVINAVKVIGGTPKKAKDPVKAKAVAKRSHPLSPWRLGRGGVPRYLWTTIQDDSLRTKKECKDLAQKVLQNGLLAGVTASADGIPCVRLQELDVVRYKTEHTTIHAPLKKFTIPLLGGQDATYGYVRKIRPRGGRKPIPRRHHHHGGRNNRKGRNTNGQIKSAGVS
jgi:hypothetical protein